MICGICPDCGKKLTEYDIVYDSGDVGYKEFAFPETYECKFCDGKLDSSELKFPDPEY
jgi:hypothetical protein